MNIQWTSFAWEDYLSWQEDDKIKARRINTLIKDIQRTPFDGIGKPERLRHDKSAYWSRRIDQEHRLVYKVVNDTVYIVQCRFHYVK